MAIYVNNIGGGDLPVSINNPQEGESLIWNNQLGAYVNAPSTASTEVIQDTVAEMVDVDPDGSQVTLRLVTRYDDVTGKLTFNVVTDSGGGGGGGGGSTYVLPTASTTVKGGVKVDGTSITIDANGVISVGSDVGIPMEEFINYLNDNNYTTTGYVNTQINNLINGAPGALNSLQELAAAIANNPNFATDLTTALSDKLNVAGGTMTGPLTLAGGPITNLQAATKKYVDDAISNIPPPTGNLDELADVNLSGATAGQVLGWNGTSWVPVNPTAGAKGDRGDTGATGSQGLRGISVSSTEIDETGHLKITLDDGSILDAGNAVGPKGDTGSQGIQGLKGDQGLQGIQGLKGDTGEQGPQGPAGRSIAANGARIDDNGGLQLTLTDGTILSAGTVVGPQGPVGAKGDQGLQGLKGDAGTEGISITTGTVNNTGHLILTKSDLSTIDVGSVVGPKGDTGEQGGMGPEGPKGDTGTSYTINNKSGSVQVYGVSNTTQPGYDLEVDLANKANKLTTARNIILSGKVTGLVSFDGSSNVNMTTSLNGVSTNDVAEGTNKYYTDARARTALSAGTGLSYNSSTGVFTLNTTTDQVNEGSANLYFTNNRFDNRLAASNLSQLADVTSTVPTTGQALIWNGNAWTPGTVATGGTGTGTSTGVYKATAQIDYDINGNLTDVSVLGGGITAAIAVATSTTATVRFTFTGSNSAPLNIQVYGYQRANNIYVTRALASDFPTRSIEGGGTSGSPTAFSGFNATTNTMTLSLTKSVTGASAGVGQSTHCIIQFLLSN